MADESPRERARRLARELIEALISLSADEPLDVTESGGDVSCRVQVWRGPSARISKPAAGRTGCRADILEVMRAAGHALTFKEIVRDLRAAKKPHGPGTVTKALAEMTKSGELVNPKDKRGYRLGGWKRDETPSLFE